MLYVFWFRQGFGKYIRSVVSRGGVLEVDELVLDCVSNEMMPEFDVFGASMKYCVAGATGVVGIAIRELLVAIGVLVHCLF